MKANPWKAIGEQLGIVRLTIEAVVGPSRWDDFLGLKRLAGANDARLELCRLLSRCRPPFPPDLSDATAALLWPLMSALQDMRAAASAQADEFRENQTLPENRLAEINREHAALSLKGWWILRQKVLPLIKQIEILLLNGDDDPRQVEPRSRACQST